MKVNFRTQMRKAKLKNLSDLSFESKIPIQQLESLFKGDLTDKDFETLNKLQSFFGCKLRNLLSVKGTIWEFDGCSYEGIIGVVYFIKNIETNLIKIGFTYDLLTRISTLATEYKTKMELVHYVSSSDIGTVEKIFHTMFSNKRTKGEWFDLSEDDVMELKKY